MVRRGIDDGGEKGTREPGSGDRSASGRAKNDMSTIKEEWRKKKGSLKLNQG